MVNNFNTFRADGELWVMIGSYKFKTLFNADEKWMECITDANGFDVFFEIDLDMGDGLYINHALDALKLYSRVSKSETIGFANREISLMYDAELKDAVGIQLSDEDEDGNYEIDVIPIERKQWLEIMEFFEKTSALFVGRIKKQDEED